ncbi:MAG: hypothetical protein AB7F19_03000 [Candidatus Babeliales bacterium]
MKKQNKQRTVVDATIVLDAAQDIQDQTWLFAPENKELLAQVKEGLQQKGTIDRGSFSEYLDE